MSDTRTPSTMKAKAAREAFEQATFAIAGEKRFADLPPNLTELEIMEAATRMVKEASTDGRDELMRQINVDFDEFHRVINDGLRISWMPTGPGFRLRDLKKYEAFLDSAQEEQAAFLKTVPDEELDFWRGLQTARAAYLKDLESERGDGDN